MSFDTRQSSGTSFDLAEALRNLRKRNFPQDTQKTFAARIGVSRPTYQRMEKGDMSVAFGSYFEAMKIHGLDQQLMDAFQPPRHRSLL